MARFHGVDNKEVGKWRIKYDPCESISDGFGLARINKLSLSSFG